MQALILAAGMGRRLRYATADNPKCLVEVNNRTLLEHSLDNLAKLPLRRIVLVVGYRGEKIRSLVGDSYNGIPVVYVDNPDYETTNNIYSLFLARRLLAEDDAILLESDLIYEEGVLRRLSDDPLPNLAVVDKYQPHMDGTVVKISDDNLITSIIPNAQFDYREIDSYYKTVNIYKFSSRFSSETYIPFLEAYCQVLGTNRFYEQVLRVILTLDQKNLWAAELQGEKWYEIDSIADLRNAELLFADNPSNKLELYGKRYGGYWRNAKLRDFCYLVNPYFPSERLLAEFSISFDNLLSHYPSGQDMQCVMAGDLLNCHERFLAVGNGAAEIITALVRRLEGSVGIIYPTFMEYPNRLGAKRTVRLEGRRNGLSYDAGFLKEAADQADCVLVVNPDNPTGNFIPRDDLLDVAAFYASKNKMLIVDESFVDFAGDGSHTLLDDAVLEANPNLTVVKSISKSHGVPGLRLGVAASEDEDLIRWIRGELSIWNINSIGEFYLQAGSKYRSDYETACRRLAKERERLFSGLSGLPRLTPYPSQANFILCELKDRWQAKELAETLLWQDDILVKYFSSRPGLENGEFIRLAVNSREDNAFLLECLRKALG